MGKKYKIELPFRGYGMSMGNMLDILAGDAAKSQEGNWIEVEEKVEGVFTVINDNMTVKNGDSITENTNLGFSQWDKEVEDLDNGESDESQCFSMSSHLKWKDVDMTPEEFKAPSIKKLKEALKHVAICAWCPGDI